MAADRQNQRDPGEEDVSPCETVRRKQTTFGGQHLHLTEAREQSLDLVIL